MQSGCIIGSNTVTGICNLTNRAATNAVKMKSFREDQSCVDRVHHHGGLVENDLAKFMDKAVRKLALDSFGLHFFSRTATVRTEIKL
ncbi:hypothetical protein KIN20_026856 [Parelaphostrongylus tenuis]|uniref:Uncharacterized protein n=1 Tax=Parelaphostrongylus tenuis TaxID=148309 RepID=A0AAD5WD82_PARTN|nr:hypothetical protein KIN20_026856 [Parelaphostrongylus tenuis]